VERVEPLIARGINSIDTSSAAGVIFRFQAPRFFLVEELRLALRKSSDGTIASG
jgi:hypothetical protein